MLQRYHPKDCPGWCVLILISNVISMFLCLFGEVAFWVLTVGFIVQFQSQGGLKAAP